MRLLQAHVENFGSYKSLHFEYTDQRLSLVSGATGAGKSTLMDIAPWIIFGKTSKDGKVDDVRSWTSDKATFGSITLNVNGVTVEIVRIRGTSSDNDLWYSEDNQDRVRGRTILDTQGLIEKLLGVTYEQYALATMFNEFSTTGNFFTSTTQEKRNMLEKIANLTLPINIMIGAKNAKKETNGLIRETEKRLANLSGRLEQLRNNDRSVRKLSIQWDKDHETHVRDLEKLAISFDRDQAEALEKAEFSFKMFEMKRSSELTHYSNEILSFSQFNEGSNPVCDACGQPNKSVIELEKKMTGAQVKLEKLESEVNPFTSEIEKIKTKTNNYATEAETIKNQINPFLSQITINNCDIDQIINQQNDQQNQILELKAKVTDLDILYELSFELRGELTKRSIESVEYSTNTYLEKYFDNEIKVKFTLDRVDSLDVQVQKSGYDCSYSQLSRGQRSMLKLCFAVSIMKTASNELGIHFHQLFFDECLDGLSSDLKLKAIGLFQELEIDHESIFVIDHATEIQNEFSKRFNVTLDEDNSKVVTG